MRQEAHDSRVVLDAGGDPALAELAGGQEGMVSATQLRSVGLDRGAVAWRVHRRRLVAVHRGVYAVGPPRQTWPARVWAALLACGGPGSGGVSHPAAGALGGLGP